MNKNSVFKRYAGSALILAVVLSSLLAIVGVLFVMTARINQMSAKALSENKDLDLAVDTVIADLSQVMVSDVPGIVNNNQELYDYPDINNIWLADLEPYENNGIYYWRQISDITGILAGKNRNVRAVVVSDFAPIPDSNNPLADSDGDGIGDSKWVRLNGITSSDGKPVYGE